MEKTRIFGQIFLPETPDNKIDGVWLVIKSNSIYLEIPLNSLANENWNIIHGTFNSLDEVTFVNAYASGGSSGAGGTWRKVIVSYMIKGAYFNKSADLAFNKIVLVSPTLSNWIIEPEGIHKSEENTYQIPEKKTIFSVPIEEVTIALHLTHEEYYSSSSLKVEKRAIIIIESLPEIHIERLSEFMRRIKKWILFVTNKNPEFSKYYLSNERKESLELVNTLDNLEENRFTQNLTFRYFDLKQSLSKVFINWMTNKSLEAVIDLIQEKNYNTGMSFQGYFLNMCVAVEYFHDQFISDRNIELTKERKEKRKIISDLIENEELKQWFRKTSKYWEKADLRDRLKAYQKPISKIMGETFEFSTADLIDKVLKTRNSMAHDGSYNRHLTHIELLLVGKVIEFTIKYEILNLLEYLPKTEGEVLKEAKRHVEILARLNKYNRNSIT